MIVEERLLRAAAQEDKKVYRVVIWGGLPYNSERLAYTVEESRSDCERAIREMSLVPVVEAFFTQMVERVIAVFPQLAVVVADVRGRTLLDIERVKPPFVFRVEPVRSVRALLNVSVPLIKADKCWRLGYEGSGVRIGVVDSGVDAYYSLEGKVVASRSFVPGEGEEDLNGHGTHVAGIAAGDEEKYRGVAPRASVISAKVLDVNGEGVDYGVALGISWACDAGAGIVNLSLGGDGHPQDLLCRLCNLLAERGIVVVAAAGNGADRGIESPGMAEKVITVGATDKQAKIAPYSSIDVKGYGKPDVVAPGGLPQPPDMGIISLRSRMSQRSPYPDEKHTSSAGTSMAAPHVSGAAAIIAEALREAGYQGNLHYAVKKLLTETARDLGQPRNAQGAGLINVEEAVKRATAISESLERELEASRTSSLLTEVAKTLALEAYRGLLYASINHLVSSLVKSRDVDRVRSDLKAEAYEIIRQVQSQMISLTEMYQRGEINYLEYQHRMSNLNAILTTLYELLRNL
ncbi:MAG: S8 family serine peptidase [Thermofilum sp.]